MSENGVRKLGRYELLFLLGQGGMGEVHLARLTGAGGFEKLCIVKTVLPNLMGDEQFIDRFHHEARVLVQLTHSNIAQVHDMGEAEGTLYMAIEYVAGVDLSRIETRVERTGATMPLPVALYMGQKICEALGYAHRKAGADGEPLDIVHRDVSPHNVMVSYEGEVKVIDFGLAKSAARSKHTQANTVMGKLGYMAPEQAMAKKVDHRSDIFSAGIVVWEMIAGRPLYESGTMSEMVARMAFAELPTLKDVRPDIPDQLNDIVMKALTRDVNDRYQRADELARALNEFAVREGYTTGSEEVGNYVRAMCPEEFAAERQLRSRLSIMRKKGSSPALGSDEVPTAQMQTADGTFVRGSAPDVAALQEKKSDSGVSLTAAQRAISVYAPSSPDLAPPKGGTLVRSAPAKGGTVVRTAPPPKGGTVVAQRPDAPDDGELPVAPKSRLPMAIAGLLAFIALAAGALWWLNHQPAEAAAAGGQGGGPVAIADPPKDPDPEPVKDPEPEKEPEPAKDPEPEPAKDYVVIDHVKADKVWKLQRKSNDDLLLLAKGDKLAEGDRLDIVGEPDEKGLRPVYAHGAVMEITGSIAHVLLDEDLVLPPTVYVSKDASGKVHVVNRPRKDPVKEPAKDPAKDPVKEPAKDPVKEPAKVPAKDPVKTVEPVKTPARLTLRGKVFITSPDKKTKARTVQLTSENAVALTACELRLTNNLVAKVPSAIPAGSSTGMTFNLFRADSRPPLKEFAAGWALMDCKEGSGFWKETFAR